MNWERAAKVAYVLLPGLMAAAMIAQGVSDEDNGVAGVGIGFAAVAAYNLQRILSRRDR